MMGSQIIGNLRHAPKDAENAVRKAFLSWIIKTENESQHPVISIQSPIQSRKCLFALLSSVLYLLGGKNLIEKPEPEEDVQCIVVWLPGKRSYFGSPQTDLVKYS